LSKRIGKIVNMKGKKVLEVGCGRGAYTCYFAKNYGAKITGIDLNPDMIKSSTYRAKEEGILDSIEFRVADASNLPFPNRSFDIVVSECGPVGLAPEPQKVVNEMVRVLKPNGYIVVHAPMWLKEIPEEERKDIQRRIGGEMFTLSEWEYMLKKAGVAEIWEEDWSGIEQISKVRPGRKINKMSDVFTLWEKIVIVLPRVLKNYGLNGLLYLNESFNKVSPLFYDGTIGTYLIRAQKTRGE
jgi:SAM-dependent methyltransferase